MIWFSDIMKTYIKHCEFLFIRCINEKLISRYGFSDVVATGNGIWDVRNVFLYTGKTSS